MKKCLRKTAMCLAIVGAVASMNLSVFAVSPITSTGGTADTTINYTVDPEWSVTIPETVNITSGTTGEIDITSSKMNLQPGQSVDVKMTTMPTVLTRKSGSETVAVSFTGGAENGAIVQGETVVANFTADGETTDTILNPITVTVDPADNQGTPKAGVYTGTATFTATLNPSV